MEFEKVTQIDLIKKMTWTIYLSSVRYDNNFFP